MPWNTQETNGKEEKNEGAGVKRSRDPRCVLPVHHLYKICVDLFRGERVVDTDFSTCDDVVGATIWSNRMSI